jgi:carboxyl-terminal processing protease
VVLLLLVASFSVGLSVGSNITNNHVTEAINLPASVQTLIPTIQPSGEKATPTDLKELFKPFWEAWDIVQSEYIDQPVNSEQLMQGAISGMLDSLGDLHTSYMDPDQYRQVNIPMQGEYDGIGAWVDTNSKYLTIVSPMPDSPAEKAGLKPGDMIVAIDGEDMTGTDANLAIRRVLGKAGTNVTLTIMREGEEKPFDVTLQRARITIKSVESRMLEDNIGYVQLSTFGEKSTDELRTALKDLLAQNPKGLILDLRNNGGGELKTAIEVASEFVSQSPIMFEEYGDGKRDIYNAIQGGLATEIPLVVLINDGTASASEIVAGAIQDYGRGKLVGTTSYGKGSVQNWIPLSDDQGAVRVTIAHWLTPKGRLIDKVGLQPDFVVEMTEEDVTASRDPQLDEAVNVLMQMLNQTSGGS